MITIVLDPYSKYRGHIDLSVIDEETYVESRLAINESLSSGVDLIIVVNNPNYEAWYDSLRRIDKTKVNFKEISLRSILSQTLNVDERVVPFGDSDIAKLGLVEKAISSPPTNAISTVGDITNWVLSASIGRPWGESKTSPRHFSDLCTNFLMSSPTSVSSAILQRLIAEKESDWIEDRYGHLYKWLFSDPSTNSFLVFSLQILKNYDSQMKTRIIENVLGHQLDSELSYVSRCIDELTQINCKEENPLWRKLSDEIEVEWKCKIREEVGRISSEIRESNPDLYAIELRRLTLGLIEHVSGRILGELHSIEGLASENLLHLDGAILNSIKVKFEISQARDIVERLSELVAPRFPVEPQVNWTWERMSLWAVNEYFPYLQWLQRRDKNDKKIRSQACVYSDWLYHNYPSMKLGLSPLNYGTPSKIERYVKSGQRILWIIVDDLSWTFSNFVKEAFEKNGFSLSPPSGMSPMLSMLPSETTTSKKSLVSGKLPFQVEADASYDRLFDDQCSRNSIGSHSYASDSDIKNGELSDSNLTCCLIRELDDKIHMCSFDVVDDIKDTVFRWAKYIRQYVQRGVEKSRIPSDKIKVIISTDHGCCRIEEDDKRIETTFLAEQPVREGSRFLFLENESKASAYFYYLDKESFALPRNVVIAKGYDFFGDKRPAGLVHGGLTPEETIIPHIELSLAPLVLSPLECNYADDGAYLSASPQNIGLSIRNVNPYEIHSVAIYVPEQDKLAKIENIPAKDQAKVVISLILSKDKTRLDRQDNAVIRCSYEYQCLGQQKSGDLFIKIRIKRIMHKVEDGEDLLF
jgi:hypothetical protein